MNILKKLILFFGSNIIGFFLPTLLYYLTLKLRLVDFEAEGFDITGFYYDLSGDVPLPTMIFIPIITWVICAIFSFAYFFVSKKWQRLFLIAPAILPLLHSIIILVQYM